MIEEIEQLIARYSAMSDALDDSIKTVNTSDLYADQREEWRWYLKGQQQALRNTALDLRVILLKKKVETNENSSR
jgi:hypothetical protein